MEKDNQITEPARPITEESLAEISGEYAPQMLGDVPTPIKNSIEAGASDLTTSHLLVAYLEASGKKPTEIARKLSRSVHWVKARRGHPQYIPLLNEAVREITAKITDTAADIEDRLNREVTPSIDRIVQIRDEGDKDADRLKAALEILDRASRGPKKKVIEDHSQRFIVQLPVQVVGSMKEALSECDESGILDQLNTLTSQPIDAEYEEVEEEPPLALPSPPSSITPRSLDEMDLVDE